MRDWTTQNVQWIKGTKAAKAANGGVTGQSLQVVWWKYPGRTDLRGHADKPPQTSHRARGQTRIRTDGTLYDSIVVTDGGAGRLHIGEQQARSTSSTETSGAKINSWETSGSRSHARIFAIPVVAAYTQGPSEPRGRVSYLHQVW